MLKKCWRISPLDGRCVWLIVIPGMRSGVGWGQGVGPRGQIGWHGCSVKNVRFHIQKRLSCLTREVHWRPLALPDRGAFEGTNFKHRDLASIGAPSTSRFECENKSAHFALHYERNLHRPPFLPNLNNPAQTEFIVQDPRPTLSNSHYGEQ
jgi:hypothetical protein